jgi:hypothetical protein
MDRPAISGMVLLVCWAIGSTIVGRSFSALDPDPTDAQLFAYFGLQWLYGHIPYVDIWDHKPPGTFAVDALVFLLFPKSFTALAWMEGIFILGCIGTVYLLMRQWGGRGGRLGGAGGPAPPQRPSPSRMGGCGVDGALIRYRWRQTLDMKP